MAKHQSRPTTAPGSVGSPAVETHDDADDVAASARVAAPPAALSMVAESRGLHAVVAAAAIEARRAGDQASYGALNSLEALLGEVRYRAAGFADQLPADLLDRILTAI